MLQYMRMRIQSMTRTERGASAVEYGLLVALIAVAIVAAVGFLGDNVSEIFTETCEEIDGAAAGGAGCA